MMGWDVLVCDILYFQSVRHSNESVSGASVIFFPL